MDSEIYIRGGVFTVTQVLEQRYQASSYLIGGAIIAAYDLIAAVIATIAIGSVTGVVFGIPRTLAIPCSGGIIIVYSMIDGMWPLTLTDTIQFVIETISIFLILLSSSIDDAGGLTRMQEVLPAGFLGLGHIGLDTVLTYFPLYFLGALIDQGIRQRTFVARSETVVRHAGLDAGVYYMPYSAACALIGVATRVLLPDLAVPEDAHAETTREVLAPGLRGLVVTVALSAIMSTVSGCLLTMATVPQEDIYARFLRPGTASNIHLSHCTTLLMGMAMLVLARLVNDVIVALSTACNLLVGDLLVPIAGALLWYRISSQGAIANIVAGCPTVIIRMACDDLLANLPTIYGLLASLATFVAVSLVIRPVASPRV